MSQGNMLLFVLAVGVFWNYLEDMFSFFVTQREIVCHVQTYILQVKGTNENYLYFVFAQNNTWQILLYKHNHH